VPPILRDIFARTRTPGFQRCLRDLLVRLCAIDTTPNPQMGRMQAAEDRCFRILEEELGSLSFPGARLERRPVNPAIQGHPNYSLLHFTKTPQRPQGLSPEEAYATVSVVQAASISKSWRCRTGSSPPPSAKPPPNR
jgi:hypothetical protein